MDRVIPFSTDRITNPYNPPSHNGVDLGYRQDEEMNKVFSNCYGEVIEVQRHQPHQPGSRLWGNFVLVRHPNGMLSRYCHLQDNIRVNPGDIVDSNTWMGNIGDSGDAEFKHLHFEVYDTNSNRIDPTPYLDNPIYDGNVFQYRVHIGDYGWQDWKNNGEIAGTTGESKRIEAIQINAPFEVQAKAHIQDIGWVDYGVINKDTIIGTTGQSKRLEDLCFKGKFRFRVHIQDTGWSAWTNADGVATLGTVGQSLRIEAIQFEEI